MNPSERLRHVRKTVLGMSLKDFSSAINMSLSNLGNIEKGQIGLTERVINDVCREFSINKEWLLNGIEPIFIENTDSSVNEIIDIYKTLNEDNQKYFKGYLHRLLEEQTALKN